MQNGQSKGQRESGDARDIYSHIKHSYQTFLLELGVKRTVLPNESDKLIYGMHKVLEHQAKDRAKKRKKYVKRAVLLLLCFILGMLLCYFIEHL